MATMPMMKSLRSQTLSRHQTSRLQQVEMSMLVSVVCQRPPNLLPLRKFAISLLKGNLSPESRISRIRSSRDRNRRVRLRGGGSRGRGARRVRRRSQAGWSRTPSFVQFVEQRRESKSKRARWESVECTRGSTLMQVQGAWSRCAMLRVPCHPRQGGRMRTTLLATSYDSIPDVVMTSSVSPRQPTRKLPNQGS